MSVKWFGKHNILQTVVALSNQRSALLIAFLPAQSQLEPPKDTLIKELCFVNVFRTTQIKQEKKKNRRNGHSLRLEMDK